MKQIFVKTPPAQNVIQETAIFFSKYRRCKFGDYCAYSHHPSTHFKVKANSDDIEVLKTKIDSILKKVEVLLQEKQDMKDKIILL